MPPKIKFDKEAIVEAAFEIAKEDGFSGVTARSVANRLGCSVAPIYVNFSTIGEVIAAVVQRVFALSDELLARQQGENLFENIGKASLAFAREYPVIFRELVMTPNPYMQSYEAIENSMLEALGQDDSMRSWTLEERRRLLLKMRVFQLGLSAMIAIGQLPSWLDDESAEALLMETGEELLLVQKMKQEAMKK